MMDNNPRVEFAVRQVFRPYVLAFLALAVAFAGWTYGYKLSQYFHHSEVTRASLTRAWLDHRKESISSASQHRLLPPRQIGLHLFISLALCVTRRSPELVLDPAAPALVAFLVSALIPFRAPPSITPASA